MAQYILNMGGNTSNSSYTNAVDVFKVTENGVTKMSNHGLTLSVARDYLSSASVGNYILAMGGHDNRTFYNTVDVFKVTTNGVEAVQNHGLSLSAARFQMAAASCGNYILAMGGHNGNSGTYYNTVDVFKVTDNGVEAVQNHGLSLSVARAQFAAASCGNYILAMGGATGSSIRTNAVDVFQVTTNGVTKIQNHGLTLSVVRNHIAAASCGNYVLAMGGYNGSRLNTVDVFEVTDNGVTKVQNHGLSLSVGRADLSSASVGNYVLAMGGFIGDTSQTNAVDVFKVTDNGVEAVPNHGLALSAARGHLAGASCGDYVLAMGGLTGNTASNAVDVFEYFE